MTQFILINLISLIFCIYTSVGYINKNIDYYDCTAGRSGVYVFAAFKTFTTMLVSVVVTSFYTWGTFEAIEYSAEFAVKYIY